MNFRIPIQESVQISVNDIQTNFNLKSGIQCRLECPSVQSLCISWPIHLWCNGVALCSVVCHDLVKPCPFQLTKVQEQHQDQMGRMTLELEDESHTRSSMDKRLAELRKEVSLLQPLFPGNPISCVFHHVSMQVIGLENKALKPSTSAEGDQSWVSIGTVSF